MRITIAIVVIGLLAACSEPATAPDVPRDKLVSLSCRPTVDQYGDISYYCSSHQEAEDMADFIETYTDGSECYTSGHLVWCYGDDFPDEN